MTMAKWGPKKWTVRHQKINPIDAVSYSIEYDQEKSEKKKAKISFSYTVYKEFGVKVRKEMHAWENLIGEKYPLYLGSKRVGPPTIQLISVGISEIKTTEDGVVRSATFSLQFAEPNN